MSFLQAATGLCLRKGCAGKLYWAPKAAAELTAEGKALRNCRVCWGCWHSPHLLWLGPWLCKQSQNPWKQKSRGERRSSSGAGGESQPSQEISAAWSVLKHFSSSILQTAAQQPSVMPGVQGTTEKKTKEKELEHRSSKPKSRARVCLQKLRNI